MTDQRVVNEGKNRAIQGFTEEVDSIAVGDDDSNLSVSNTELGNEIFSNAATAVRTGTGQGSFSATIPATSAIDGQDIVEMGLFNDPELLVRFTFAEIRKQAGVELIMEAEGEVTQ